MGWMSDETGLEKSPANYVPLTPLSALRRASRVFSDRTAVVYGDHRVTYPEYIDRCTRLASALAAKGVKPGDVVATILPNIPAHAEAHFGVPACGAVLNSINTRLDVGTVGYIFDHGGAKVALVDAAFIDLAEAAIAEMEGDGPEIIEVPDDAAGFPATGRHPTYEQMLAEADPAFDWIMPEDEWESHRAQLHLRHDRAAQGRRLPPPRRVSERDGPGAELADGAASGLPHHRAALSLQRLVPHLDDADGRRHGGLLPRHHGRRTSSMPSRTRA